jgi:hypothetical protein
MPGTEEKINLSVKEESRVSIYEANEMARVKLVLALTKNHQDFLEGKAVFTGNIKFGSVSIRDIPDCSKF